MISTAICIASALLILYILFGYPVLLGVLSKSRARPVRRKLIRPAVSIIVPAYNGEKFIADKLDSILSLDYPAELMEILVVSDGSTDSTADIVRSYANRGVRLLEVPRGGKPAALNASIPLTRGEILVLTDVRQPLDPPSVGYLVEAFADPNVGAVSGELLIRSGSTAGEANIGLYWRFESWIRNRLSAIDSMFGATGPFYALRRDLAVHIPPDTLLDDMYLPISAFFRGYRLVVDRRARAWDPPIAVKNEFRRKVRTLAGNYQLLGLFPQLLGPKNRMWFHFVSYKFGRLILPWALIAFALASCWLPDPMRTILLAGQALFYGLAALDSLLPEGSALKRWSSPAGTFVVMMIAALAGLKVFFVPPQSLWKVTSASSPDGMNLAK